MKLSSITISLFPDNAHSLLVKLNENPRYLDELLSKTTDFYNINVRGRNVDPTSDNQLDNSNLSVNENATDTLTDSVINAKPKKGRPKKMLNHDVDKLNTNLTDSDFSTK